MPVSLTFDDGVASQLAAADLLEARGVRGTFFVPSGFVGRRGYLRWGDVGALADRGHEIGGHTASHARITELDARSARREVEDDRRALVAHGVAPVTFAYPYGACDDPTASIVREAGYRAARAVGGIVETLPPQDAHRLRTPNSPRRWTTAEQLQAFALTAEHQRGWLIVPFHHITADPGSSSYATSPADLASFVDWLLARGADVRPVRDVVAAD